MRCSLRSNRVLALAERVTGSHRIVSHKDHTMNPDGLQISTPTETTIVLTRTCLVAAGKDILRGESSSLRLCSPPESCRMIARRAGWARAWKTTSSRGGSIYYHMV